MQHYSPRRVKDHFNITVQIGFHHLELFEDINANINGTRLVFRHWGDFAAIFLLLKARVQKKNSQMLGQALFFYNVKHKVHPSNSNTFCMVPKSVKGRGRLFG